MSAYIGAGITQGFANAAEYERQRPARERQAAMEQAKIDSANLQNEMQQAQFSEWQGNTDMRASERQTRLDMARTQQQMAQAKLTEFTQTAPLRRNETELALQQTQMQLSQIQREVFKNETYNAFRAYNGDNDPRHLNNLLKQAKQNPAGDIWNRWARFDSIVAEDQEVGNLLGSMGLDANFLLQRPELASRFVIGTEPNGNRAVIDVGKLMAMTGYTQYMEDNERQQAMDSAKIISTTRGLDSSETNLIRDLAEQNDIPLSKAAVEYYKAKNAGKSTGTARERLVENILAENPGWTYGQATKEAARISAAPTATNKDLTSASKVRAELDSEGFFEADLTDPATRRKFGPKITELENYTGKELSGEDKRLFRQLRQLTALGTEAGTNITDAQAGWFDSTFRDVRAYMTNEIGDTKGVAAYQTFRTNLMRIMSGATITTNEQQALIKSLGSLYQQKGPVLSKLLTQLEDVNNQMQSIYDTNDEHVAHYYLARGLDDIDNSIEQIESLVNNIRAGGGGSVTQADYRKPQLSDEEAQAKLDEIFGG